MTPRRAPTIVYFTNSVAIGGMEAHLAMLAAGLRRRGMSVAAFLPDYASIDALRDELRSSGVDLYAFPGTRGAAGLPLRLARMIRELRRHRPFIFHLHNTGSDGGLLPIVAARVAGASTIVRTEHLPPLPPVSARQRMLVRLRDMITDRVICVSEEAREQHIAIYGRRPDKLVAIANGIAADEYRFTDDQRAAARARLGAAKDAIVIGAMGRMAEERKGFDTFIDMAAIVAGERSNAQFVLIGDGPLRAGLERLAEHRGLAGRLRFTGAIDNRQALPGIDIFVSPSISDGGPITVLEAMASGVPVISTNVGVAREAIEDTACGRLVRVRDTAAMADAVLSLYDDPRERAAMGDRGRAAVLGGFTIEHMVQRVADVYAAIGGAPTPGAQPAHRAILEEDQPLSRRS